MAPRLIGKDPETGSGNSPTVWLDDASQEILIQGWTVDTEMRAACAASGPIPDTEEIVRLPFRIADVLRRACDGAERPVV